MDSSREPGRCLRLGLVTLFPNLFTEFLATGFVGRAAVSGQLEVVLEDLREFGLGKHRSVDDTPYGGGPGMVMRVDCVVAAIEAVLRRPGFESAHRVLLTPQGRPFRQSVAAEWVERGSLVVVCGRYEGFDERVRDFVDEEASLGDFVMTGGEVAAMAMVESCVRLLPGVLGNDDSHREESFSDSLDGLLEYPQYTRPVEFRGLQVPDVLKSGHHEQVRKWRRAQSERRTAERRPELLRSRSRQ